MDTRPPLWHWTHQVAVYREWCGPGTDVMTLQPFAADAAPWAAGRRRWPHTPCRAGLSDNPRREARKCPGTRTRPLVALAGCAAAVCGALWGCVAPTLPSSGSCACGSRAPHRHGRGRKGGGGGRLIFKTSGLKWITSMLCTKKELWYPRQMNQQNVTKGHSGNTRI